MVPRLPRRRPVAAAVLAGAVLSCLAAAPARGQAAPATSLPVPVLHPVGTQVRIFAPRVLESSPTASPWFIGPLVDADTASVTVRTATGATVAIPRGFVAEFAVRAGPADRARSVAQAALVGVAFGLLAGKVSTPPGSANSGEPGRHLRNGALIGVLGGVAFATLTPWHRWINGPPPTAALAAEAR